MERRVTVRATALVRAGIIASLLGHWLANALFDRDQYAGAGSDLVARLDDPFLAQAAIGLLAVTVLALWDRRRGDRGRRLSMGKLPLALLLVGLQLAAFVGLESSERLIVDVWAGEAADVGIFGVGFVAELLVAVVSGILLVVLTEAARRFLSPGPADPVRAEQEPGLPSLARGSKPAPSVLSGAGGVRAPPS